MSSILNALRKLEEERRPASEGPLQEDVALAPVRNPRLALWAATASAGIAVAVLAVLLARGLWREAPSVSKPAQSASAASVPPREARPALPRSTEAARVPSPRTRTTTRAGRPAGVSTSVLRPTAQAPQPPPRAVREAAVARPVAPATTTPPTRTESAPLPPPPAPPVEIGALAPAPMRVAQIAWHPDAGLRRAWLRVDGEDGRREVREGDQVGSYTVHRIDPSSVLFQSGEIELRRSLGDKS